MAATHLQAVAEGRAFFGLTPVPAAPEPTPGPTFVVDRIVEQERDLTITHAVQVQLSPVVFRMVVGDFARAIQRARENGLPITSKLAAAGVLTNDLARQDALTEVLHILGMTPTAFLLTPDEADVLAADLHEAAEEPATLECGCLRTGAGTVCGWHR